MNDEDFFFLIHSHIMRLTLEKKKELVDYILIYIYIYIELAGVPDGDLI